MKVINDLYVQGAQPKTQYIVHDFVTNNPNCTLSDIYTHMVSINSKTDLAGIRKVVRRMIEGHKIRQRFTVENP